MARAEISMPKVMSGILIAIVITGRRRTAIRTWLGVRLLCFAARVIGCNIEISDVR